MQGQQLFDHDSHNQFADRKGCEADSGRASISRVCQRRLAAAVLGAERRRLAGWRGCPSCGTKLWAPRDPDWPSLLSAPPLPLCTCSELCPPLPSLALDSTLSLPPSIVLAHVQGAFMSTTKNPDVAKSYAGGSEAGGTPMVMEMEQGMVDRGAAIEWLSQVCRY